MASKAEAPQFVAEGETTEIKKKSGAGRPPGAKNKKTATANPESKADIQMSLNELFNGLAFLLGSDASFIEGEFAKQAELYARLAERFPFVQAIIRALLPLAAFAQTINKVRKLFGGITPKNPGEPKASWLERRRQAKAQREAQQAPAVVQPPETMTTPARAVSPFSPTIPPQA